MTRLTNAIRDKIIKNATDKALTEANAKLEQLRNDFTTGLLAFAVGDKLEQLQGIQSQIETLVASIPKEFRLNAATGHSNKAYTVRVNVAGLSVDWSFDDWHTFPIHYSNDRFVIPHGHELVNVWNEYEKQREFVQSRTDTVQVNVKAMVYSATTVKKLIELWPECVELLPATIDKPAVNLPSVKVEELNSLIGIPTEGK